MASKIWDSSPFIFTQTVPSRCWLPIKPLLILFTHIHGQISGSEAQIIVRSFR